MPVFIFIGSRYTIETVALSIAVGFLVLFIPNWWYLVKYMTGATLTEFLKAIMPKFFLKELKEKFFSQKLK